MDFCLKSTERECIESKQAGFVGFVNFHLEVVLKCLYKLIFYKYGKRLARPLCSCAH